jgi:histone H3/H4
MATGFMLNQSAAREQLKSIDPEIRVGEEFITALNDLVAAQMKLAIERCKANGRKTLQKQDL